MTLSFLYRRRTFWRDFVWSMGLTPLCSVGHGWHKPHFQNINVLKQSWNHKVLRTNVQILYWSVTEWSLLRVSVFWNIMFSSYQGCWKENNWLVRIHVWENTFLLTYLWNMLSVFPMMTPFRDIVEIVSTPSNMRTALLLSLLKHTLLDIKLILLIWSTASSH